MVDSRLLTELRSVLLSLTSRFEALHLQDPHEAFQVTDIPASPLRMYGFASSDEVREGFVREELLSRSPTLKTIDTRSRPLLFLLALFAV
jgi:hypothetical protein